MTHHSRNQEDLKLSEIDGQQCQHQNDTAVGITQDTKRNQTDSLELVKSTVAKVRK
jgi:hypothetical protein